MTTVLVCLVIAMFLPIVAKAPVAWAMNKEGGYDNAHPRTQQATLTGLGARALAAHQNAFEALIFFTPAVAIAVMTNQVSSNVEWAAIGFVAMRVLYNILYLINQHTLRSVSWGIGMVCCFYIAIQAVV